MIGQNHIPPDGPAMSIMSRAPFINTYLATSSRASIFLRFLVHVVTELNRRINPNAPKPSQVFVHCAVVAEGVDLGNPTASHAHWPRSATAASSVPRRKRFRIGARNFAYRDPADSADERAE